MRSTSVEAIDVTSAPYLAAGDGSTNDQPAIQRAIDDGAGRGCAVVLPAGRTFVAGHLTLPSGTTLVIDGILRQSENPEDYGYGPARGHDLPGGQAVPYHLGSRENLPLLHASRVNDVTITGSGTLLMMGGSDDTVINVAPIGLYRVDGFTISGLRIRESHSWMVMLYVSRNGTVEGLDLESTHRNSDGVCILNSQHITVRDNRMQIADDGVYVRTEYNSRTHRPDIHWYSTRWPVGTSNILVCDNDIVSRTRGFAFIPWGAGAPDQNAIEISDVTVRDNRFVARLPISSWTDDPTHGHTFRSRSDWQTNASNYDNHVPIKNVTILGNTCVQEGELNASDRHTEFRHLSRITNLTTDLGHLSWPGTDYAIDGFDAPLPNGSFETGGLAHWSSQGTAAVVTPDRLDIVAQSAPRRTVADLFHRPIAWGPAGFITGADGPARLFQGLGLKHSGGEETTWYEFSLDVVAGPAGATVMARVDRTDVVLAEAHIAAGESRCVLRIPVSETTNPVEVGVAVDAGDEHWVLVQQARLRHLAQ